MPPRPRFREPQQDPGMPPLGGGSPPDDDDDDDLMGPPGPGPASYPDLLQPEARSSDQVLLNEGINRPTAPPPQTPSFVQQAQGAFANAAGNAARQVVCEAAGQAAAMGNGQMLARAAAAAGAGGALVSKEVLLAWSLEQLSVQSVR